MIASLNGKLLAKDFNYAVIECGGIGFKCTITQSAYQKLGSIGETAFLYTHLAVREDALDLYGFCDESELNMFKLITSVSGVGPKIGIAMLSELDPDKISLYIASGDAKSLTAANGVGLKLAQRVVLELKDKIGSVSLGGNADAVAKVGNATSNSNTREAIEALASLGFTQSEASLAVGRLDATLPTDTLIKQALQTLSRGI